METKLAKALIAIAALASSLASAAHWSWKYRVLHSPHFEVIYRDNQKALAETYIQAAEKAHSQLMPIFKEGPTSTIIFLNDETDAANGLADFLPYPHIVIYPTLPTTTDSIDDYGDWPYEMVVHEYTHILNMYPAHGAYSPFKYVFGSVTRPNAILPRWYLEGLAVDLETALSDHGRLRSTDSDASARALVHGNRLRGETLARINESEIPTWPYGGRPYLFGAWWWENAHLEKGDSLIGDLNQNFSRRLPFMLDGPMLEHTGKTTEQLLAASYDRVEARAKNQLRQIQSSHPPTSADIADEKGQQSVFAISPSGLRMVYFHSQRLNGTTIKLKTKTSPSQSFKEAPSEILIKASGALQARWMDDENILFDQIDTQNPYVNYRDLYVLNIKNKGIRRITTGARAQEASPAPSGSRAAFIQNGGGRNQLALVDLTNGEITVLARGSFTQRLSSPEFLDENHILFALRGIGGEETIHVYDLQKQEHTLWNQTLKSAQNLRRVANGFLVTDAGTRARNVYWLHDDKTEAISNTLTGIDSADYDPLRKELIITELTADGPRLRSAPFAIQSPPALTIAERTKIAPPQDQKLTLRDEDYNPTSYLLPSYWIPFIYQVEGGAIIQGMTSQSDPVGRNTYSLMGSFDTVTQKGSYGANYTNSSLPTAISLGYAKAQTYLGASAQTFDSQIAQVSFAQFWPFQSRKFSWNAGALWSDTFSRYRRLGPQLGLRYSNLEDPLRFGYAVHAEIKHQQFVSQPGYIDYGRTYLHLANRLQFNGGHKVWLQTRAVWAPNLALRQSVLLGERNVGANYLVNLANSDLLLRGYPSGEFSGRTVINANLEYSLPAYRLDRGWGTLPLFLRQMEVALFVDGMSVDGYGYDLKSGYVPVTLEQFHMGTGAELRLNTTAAYHLPMTFTVGLYYGLSERFAGGLTPFFGIGFNELGPLGTMHKTP